MKLGTVLKIVGVLVIAVIVAVVAIVMSMDFNQYKPEIIAEAKKATGRDLKIDGDIKLAISLTPALAVSGVSFSNATWGSQPVMAKVETFEAQVAILPLLSGTVDVQKIVIIGADILLEKNAKGEFNFVFEPAGGAAPAASQAAPAESSGGAGVIPVIRQVTIEKSRVTYRDAAAPKPISLVVNELSLKGDGLDSPLNLNFDGAYNDNAISMAGTLGAPSAMMSGGKPFPVKLDIKAGGATVALSGAIADVAAARGLDLTLAVSGQSLETLSPLAGSPVPPIGPYSVNAKVTGDADKAVTLSGLAVKIGGSDLSGTVTANLSGAVPSIDADLKSTKLDVADFAKPGKPAEGGGQPAASGSGGAAGDGRVFPDDPLPLDGLKAVNAKVKLAIETLVAAVQATKVEVALTLKGGDLNIAPLKATVADGAVDGTVRLNAAAATPALDTNIKVTQFDAGKFLNDMQITDLLEGKLNVIVDIKGQGGSVRKIMAGLNSTTQLAMGAGRMKSTALDTYVGGIGTLLPQMFAGKKSEYTVINCAISQFDIQKGLATSKALAFDTDYITIGGGGTINLATEELSIDIDPQPKSATVNTAVPIEVRGTLANPTYGVNKLAAARKIGGLVGGVAFPPALILGLGETGTGGANPCLSGGGGAKPAAQQQQPAQQQPANPVENLKEGVGGALKGLFGK
jgi:uncharacterized protein involved in outer membrane biogenesis